MKSIDEDIKNGTFRTAYLLYGEEAYLKKTYRDKLKKALSTDGDTMNFAGFQGKDVAVSEVIDLSETLPFFAEHRLILIEDSGLFKGSEEKLSEYIAQIPQTTTILFVESEVDKRSKLYKALKEHGKIVEFAKQNEELLTRWLLGRLKRENKNITKSAMQEFFLRVGMDMSALDREMEKVLCYCYDQEIIEKQDIEAICPQQVENRIFEMIDAITDSKRKQALELYYDLLALKVSPMIILTLFHRQCNILMQIKELKNKNMNRGDIARQIGVPGFAVGKYQAQAAKLSQGRIRQILEYGVHMEEQAKTGQMNENIAVELLIVEASKERKF